VRSLILLVVAATAVGQADILADVELLRSIRNDDEAVIRSLLDRGADVNAKDTHGATALMHAALYARPASVKLLLERGADPNRVNTSGATALMWAVGSPETAAQGTPY
jgi:ankyrin repeat protein